MLYLMVVHHVCAKSVKLFFFFTLRSSLTAAKTKHTADYKIIFFLNAMKSCLGKDF